MNVHNADSKPFECTKCSQRFITEASLMRHEIMHSDLVESITVDNNKEKKHFCMICQKEFQSQESVASHIRTHKDEMKTLEVILSFNTITK